MMNKNTFKFEVSFNLNTADGEKLDPKSIQDFRDALEGYVHEWSGYHGYFYAYAKNYDRDVTPTNVKVKKTWSAIQKKKNYWL